MYSGISLSKFIVLAVVLEVKFKLDDCSLRVFFFFSSLKVKVFVKFSSFFFGVYEVSFEFVNANLANISSVATGLKSHFKDFAFKSN